MVNAIRNAEAPRARLCGVLLTLLCATPAVADDDSLAPVRTLFVLQYAALESGATLPSAADSAALRAYPLYPYLQRARIAGALRKAKDGRAAVDDQAEEFLAQYHGQPVAADLRRAWLKSLAARNQWGLLAVEFQPGSADTALHCQWLSARIALGGDEHLAAAVIEQWLTGQRLPPECEGPFEWLRAQDAMSEALIERRVRLLLGNGQAAFARTVARRLPENRASPLLHWADLIERPERSLDAMFKDATLAQRLEPDALFAGWSRLARVDPDAALARTERLGSTFRLNDEQTSKYSLALALGLAWNRQATEALQAFRKVSPADLDDLALSWQARAALWVGDWAQVERSIAAMSAEQRAHARWHYWAARAAAARGATPLAEELYTALLPNDNFYSANAAARLGRPATPHPEALGADDAQIARLAARPEFVRTRELLLAGLRSAAVTEWLHAVGALDESERTQAVVLASRWQWHDVSVATATRQSVFFDYALLYPRPYDDEVRAAAQLTQLDSPLIYGVIRQESLFRPDALSSAGAVGLAQVLPETARRVARTWQRPAPQIADLLEPRINIELGAAYLRDLIERFDRQTPVALAGYNAGPLAAQRWLPAEPIDRDIWVENIPYNETRDYVQRVLWHSVVFRWLQTGAGDNVDSWLAPIAPRAAPADANAQIG
jgi:soluble lytic murein transglycosylase